MYAPRASQRESDTVIKRIRIALGDDLRNPLRNPRVNHWARGFIMATRGPDCKIYGYSCLPFNRLPMRKAHRSINKVEEELSPERERDQVESGDAML